MADRFATSIKIGGAISNKTLRGLATAIRDNQFGFIWGDELSGTESTDEVVLALRQEIEKQDGKLVCVNIQCAEESLSDFCREHNLPYCKSVEGRYEFNGEIRWWVPGMEEEAFSDADAEGSYAMISVDKVIEFIEENFDENDPGFTLNLLLAELHEKHPPEIMRLMPCE